MKNTISDMKNSLEGIKSRLYEAVGQITDLEDKVGKNSRQSKKKKKHKKNKEFIRAAGQYKT